MSQNLTAELVFPPPNTVGRTKMNGPGHNQDGTPLCWGLMWGAAAHCLACGVLLLSFHPEGTYLNACLIWVNERKTLLHRFLLLCCVHASIWDDAVHISRILLRVQLICADCSLKVHLRTKQSHVSSRWNHGRLGGNEHKINGFLVHWTQRQQQHFRPITVITVCSCGGWSTTRGTKEWSGIRKWNKQKYLWKYSSDNFKWNPV